MRWMGLGMWMLALVVLGCPEVHRQGGLADRAAHRDALERIPERCTPRERKEFCEDGKEDTEECLRKCGG